MSRLGMRNALECIEELVMQGPSRRSTEHYGLGQSGYTAGRIEGDPALPLTGLNVSYPKNTDEEHVLELGLDERFIGGGGRRWVPEQPKPKE